MVRILVVVKIMGGANAGACITSQVVDYSTIEEAELMLTQLNQLPSVVAFRLYPYSEIK